MFKLSKFIWINQMGDSGSHMDMGSNNDLLNLLLSGIIVIGLIILISLLIFFIFFYKKYKIVPTFKGVNTNIDQEVIEGENSISNLNYDNINTVNTNELSFSIDEQFYQKKQIIQKLSSFPNGVVQSKIPSLTNLSKATVSRRLNELFEEDLIEKIPSGRSNLIILKNN